MSQETFARVEKKYVISREQYEWIRQFLAEYTVEDEYGQSTIRNVYYDTPGEEMIRHSIQKPEFKEKVRVRGYGKIGRNDNVFVELKRKYQGIVYKRRVSMPLSEAEKFLARRRSWNSAEGKDVCCQGEKGSQSEMVRKVFLPQKERPNQEEGDFVHRQILREPENLYFEQGEVVMEIKCGSAYPLWLCRMLGGQKIYPTSFSKYGAFYKKERNQQYDGKCD